MVELGGALLLDQGHQPLIEALQVGPAEQQGGQGGQAETGRRRVGPALFPQGGPDDQA
ncbi:hypothetical protein D3C85_1852140 [compost metagenome]